MYAPLVLGTTPKNTSAPLEALVPGEADRQFCEYAVLAPTNKMAIASNEAGIATNKKEDDQEFAKVNERFAGLSEYVKKDTVTLYYPPESLSLITRAATDAS